jgi:RNA polymerase sigma-70 factor (sigma-E family)
MGALSMADRRAGGGDDGGLCDEALGELYAAHWVSLVRLASLLMRHGGGAEEIVQDAFVTAYPRLGRLRAEGTAQAYLRRSVVNGCRSRFRRRRVESHYLEAARAAADVRGRETQESAEATAARHDDEAHLLEAVRRLPQRQREVVVLRYYADLSEQQIAEALGISTGSVKTHASRALGVLRTSLGERS